MDIQSATYSVPDLTMLRVMTTTGIEVFVPVTPVRPKNRHYRDVEMWVAAGGVIGDYVPPVPSADTVRRAAMDEAAETQDLATRAANATNAQVDTWLLNNLTNVAQARVIVGAIIKRLIAKGLL